MPKETMDQVYVFAQVKVHNQSKQPLFLHNIMTNTTLDDGIHSSYAATAATTIVSSLRIRLCPCRTAQRFRCSSTINPGQTVEGTIVSAFQMTKQQWDARKDLSFTFAFQYSPA